MKFSSMRVVDAGCQLLRAEQFLRRLTGRSRASLVAADDGWYYAVKPPQKQTGCRELINEWIASRLLERLGIRTAVVRPILVSEETSRQCGWDADLLDAARVDGGWLCAAAAYPCDPIRGVIYDLWPDSMAHLVVNADHIVGALVADVWMAQQEPRQAVFYRDENRKVWAMMIDHGGALGGANWDGAVSTSLLGIGARWAYRGLHGMGELDRWAEAVCRIEEDWIRQLFRDVPSPWLGEGDASRLEERAEWLIARREPLPALLYGLILAAPESFPCLHLRIPARSAQSAISSSQATCYGD